MKLLATILPDALRQLAEEIERGADRSREEESPGPLSGDTVNGVTYRVIATGGGGSRGKGNVIDIGERRRNTPKGEPQLCPRSPISV